jgi:hypothetical protein
MMPVIRIPDSLYERLQKLAVPFTDTPATVIERLLDAFENELTRGNFKSVLQREPNGLLFNSDDEQGSEDQTPDSWPGFWFVNVGEMDYRNWDDSVQYGFLAAGWGRVYTEPLRKLGVGSKVFAYMKGVGYVGYGEVTQEARPVEEFKPDGYNTALLELPLSAEEMDHSLGDPDQCEWVVGVKWHQTFPREQAKTFSGIFANQHIVCKLRDQRTLNFLRREFNVQLGEE